MIDGATPYVATFYSFKGGVGRTTLLVNVAHALARRGERVVIWDLDLEAPGVHHFPGLEPPERPWQSGFLEWLGATPLGDGDEPAADWPPADWLRTLGDRVYPAGGGGAGGKIFVLPAHGTGADVGKVYASVDWTALFVQRPWHSVHLFKRVRDELIARFDPSFVLVDSRTGITDLGGMLTGFLPDCTVLVGNYSAQSTHGLRSVYVALDRFANPKHLDELRRERRLERLVVASPVPTAPVARDRGRARWLDGFPGVAPRSLVEVPLVENLLYAEDVLVRSAPSSDAARAYTEVANQLVGLRDARANTEAQKAPAQRRTSDAGHELALEVRVARLLGMLGFEITSREATRGPDRGIDILARDRRPLGGARLAIECKSGMARADARWRAIYQRVREQAEAEKHEPMLIAEQVSAEARAAARAAGVELRAVGELEDQLVDLRAYRDALRRDFEDSGLARAYVGQRFRGGSGDGDAVESTLAWLHDTGPRLMLVVGGSGSGKSSFLRRLAYELVTRSSDEASLPTPLLIDLLDSASISSLETVLQDHLRRTIGWHGNPEAILYLLEVGRIVLLLDGFDELSSTSSEIGAEEQLRVLSRPAQQEAAAPTANRVIVSCRKQFAGSDKSGEPVTAETMASRLGATLRELAPFTDEERHQYMRNRLGAKAGVAIDNLRQTQRAAELLPTPLYLDLITQNEELFEGQATDDLSVTQLFEQATRGWLTRGVPGTVLKPSQRARLVERLAAELWRLSDHELSHVIFAERLANDPAQFGRLTVEQLDRELRSASFLVRSATGTYRFSHSVFLEYFLACHLFHRAATGLDELRAALATERLSPTCVSLFVEMVRAAPDQRPAVKELLTLLHDASPDITDNAKRLLQSLEVVL